MCYNSSGKEVIVVTVDELNQVVSSLAIVYLQKSDKLTSRSKPSEYVEAYREAVNTFTHLITGR